MTINAMFEEAWRRWRIARRLRLSPETIAAYEDLMRAVEAVELTIFDRSKRRGVL